jgi:outer membrane receptor for ferrienterochelin and colicins
VTRNEAIGIDPAKNWVFTGRLVWRMTALSAAALVYALEPAARAEEEPAHRGAAAAPPEVGAGVDASAARGAAASAPGVSRPPEFEPAAAGAFADLSLESLLDMTIIASTGSAQSLRSAPSVVTVYTRADIAELGARNLMDLLRLTPGYVELADLSQRNLATRGVFGPSVQHVLILLDGHRINDTTNYAASPDWITLDYIERVEIIRGPGSSVYGANAFTGVINLVVQKGADTAPRVRAVYGLYDTRKASVQYGYRSPDGLDLLLSASVWRSDGYRYHAPANEDLPVSLVESGGPPTASAGIMRINGYGPSYDLFAKMSHGHFTLRANAMLSDFTLSRGQKGSLLDYLGEGTPNANDVVLGNPELFRPYRRDSREFIELEYNRELIDRGTLTLKIFGDHFKEEQHGINMSRNLQPPEGWVVFFGGQNQRLGGEANFDASLLDWLGLRVGTTIESTRATNFFVDDNRRGTLVDANPDRADLIYAGRLAENGHDAFGGAFTNLTFLATESLTFTAGGRVDYHEIYKFQTSPRLAAVYQPFPFVFAKALYGEAYQAPPYLYRSGSAAAGYQGQPNLRPQYMRTTELVLGCELGDMLYVDTNAFYNQLTNFIRADFEGTPYSFRNQGEMTLMGLDSTIRLSFFDHRLDVMLNGHYNQPVTSKTSAVFLKDGSLISVPRTSANFSVSVKPSEASSLSLTGNYHGAVEFPIRNPAANNAAAYEAAGVTTPYALDHQIAAAITLNAAASYAYGPFGIGVSAHNFLDTADYAGGSVPVPYRLEGRTLLGSLLYQPE